MASRQRTAVAIVVVAWLAYAIAYPLTHDLLDPHTGILALIPVIATAWFGGALAGLVAGVVTVPFTGGVALATGLDAGAGLSQSVLLGAGAMVVVGYVVGYVRELNARAFQERDARRVDDRALRDNESRFRALLEHHLDGVAVVVDGKIAYVNPAVCKMFGYEEHEFLGTEPSFFLADRDRDRARHRIRAHAKGEIKTVAGNYEAIRSDGTRFPLEVIARRIDYGGRKALLSQLRDLSHSKLQETALREAEAKYRTLVENSLAGVSIGQNRRFVYVNPKFAQIVGYTQEELVAMPSILDVVFEDDRPLVEEKLRQRLEGEVDAVHYTGRIQRKDGSVIEVEVNGAMTKYLGRTAIISTILDVTERRRAEEQLRASERRFRTLFEESPIGMVMSSMDARIERVNGAFCQMLGYTQAELVGRSIVDITHPDDAAGTPESAARVMEDAKLGVRYNKRYLRKDGGIVQAEATVSIVRDDEAGHQFAVAMVQDVTDQRQLEEQLQQILRLESVGQLAGGVAHNFNNALTAISGYSELLARRFDAEDPALRDLEQIQRVTEESAQLTQQLLAFSRKEDLQPSVFCLNDSVESTRDLLSPLLGDEVRIHLRLDRDLPNVSSDRPQIEQVITNLVLNARDAMPEGGRLWIATESVEVDESEARVNPDARPGRYVQLTVADTGDGMDPDTLKRIFEPFFTTKDPGRGVGLGLAMVHGVIRQSGGFIRVESAPGAGSTFVVYLPVQDGDAKATPRGETVH